MVDWKKVNEDRALNRTYARVEKRMEDEQPVQPVNVKEPVLAPSTIVPSPRQAAAKAAALSGDNVFMTGPGGTGKSEMTRDIVATLRGQGKKVAVTASTGIAAIAVGGTTLHSLMGLGIAGNRAEAMKKLGPETIARVQKRLQYVDTIVVDEISMITGDHLDMADWWLNMVAEASPGNFKPFGGYQMIFVGDFLQLPPVVKDDAKLVNKYAFQSESWANAKLHECYLTKSFRQGDREFVRHLNRIRLGELDDETIEFFAPCVGRKLDEPTRLFPTNREAQDLNMRRLDGLKGSYWSHEALLDGNDKWFDALRNNCIAEVSLELKLGAPVIFLKNNRELGYINGMRGVVRGFHADYIEVEATDGRTFQVPQETWEMTNADNLILASLTQYPLKLAWALTCHKSQGMTLERVQVDLTNTFERAMGYVSLSRAKSLEGLSLDVPLHRSQVRASKQCVDYYTALRERQV